MTTQRCLVIFADWMVRYWLVPFGGIQMILKIVENPNERGFQFVQMLFGAYHGEKQVHLAFGHALTSPKNYQFIDISLSLFVSFLYVCLSAYMSIFFSNLSLLHFQSLPVSSIYLSLSLLYLCLCLYLCLSLTHIQTRA